MPKVIYTATGRRKTAVARIRVKNGTGVITVNKKPIDEYMGRDTLKMIVYEPLKLLDVDNSFDIDVNVRGGGLSGQAGAISLGISRALVHINPDYRKILRKAGFLTRDPRMKERKKYGLAGARRAYQFSKR